MAFDESQRAIRTEAALIGLLADLRDYLDGQDRDLEFIAADIERELGLIEAVATHRKG